MTDNQNSEAAPSFVIRPYRHADRAAVRTIACDTADAGHPVERFFPDRELFADVLTAYYTDFEPESSWVGDVGGEVVGYVNGCLSTTRFERTMRKRLATKIALKALLRGTWARPQAIRFVRMNWSIWVEHGRAAQYDAARYPSQLHVNLKPGFRGKNLGRALVDTFIQYARDCGSRGIAASVREDNERARRFFEKIGFVPIGNHAVLRMEPRAEPIRAVVYGLGLGAG